MGWNLADGRNKFFGTRGMDQRHSFWWHYLGRIGTPEALQARDDPANAPAMIWAPNQSNCPELEMLIVDTLERLQPPIREVLSGIFVGRAISADINAEAFHENGRAYVVLPIQYMHAAEAYIAAWDRFRAAGADGRTSTADLLGVLEGVQSSRADWADRGAIFPAAVETRTGPNGRGAEEYGTVLTAVEQWLIAHEWAHHLLGHEANSPKELRLEHALDRMLEFAGQLQRVQAAPTQQQRELKADVLATMLLAGGLDNDITPRPEDIFLTLIGGAIALIAEGHVHDNWSSAPSDTHPGAIERLRLLLQFGADFYGAATVERNGLAGHVEGLCSSLATFANVIAQSSMWRVAPDVFPAPIWDLAVGLGLDRQVGLVKYKN